MGMARSWVGDRAVAGRDLPLGVWGGSPASADRRALRRQTKVLVFPRAGLQPAGRVAMVLLSVRGRNQERTTTGWECGNLAVSIGEGIQLLDGPWRSDPHARQRCVANIAVDAEDYPDGDPQNGQ